MALEDNIQQKTFSNEQQKALINILYTYNHLVNKISGLLKTHNITRQQYNVLRILRGQYPTPIGINAVKERMLDRMSDASRIVERLKAKNLVEKKIRSSDKRQSSIIITSEGLNLLETLDPVFDAFKLENIQLNNEEARTLNHLLDKLIK